jgi:hypothetical protein
MQGDLFCLGSDQNRSRLTIPCPQTYLQTHCTTTHKAALISHEGGPDFILGSSLPCTRVQDLEKTPTGAKSSASCSVPINPGLISPILKTASSVQILGLSYMVSNNSLSFYLCLSLLHSGFHDLPSL